MEQLSGYFRAVRSHRRRLAAANVPKAGTKQAIVREAGDNADKSLRGAIKWFSGV